MFNIEFRGFHEVRRAFDSAERAALDELASAVDQSGEHLIATAQQLAPKLTGDLEGSGTKQPLRITASEIVSQVGFRGLPYTRRRHEEVYSPGPITAGKPQVDGMTPGRKYMEQPAVKYQDRYPREWAAAVRSVLS